MAKRKSGGSSVGLIVTLIFFVLATFVAGTVAYFGYEEIDTWKAKAADAKKKQERADSELRQERIRKATLRISMGVDDPNDRLLFVQELEPLRVDIKDEYDRIKRSLSEKGTSITRKELDNIVKELDKKNAAKSPDDKTETAVFTFNWPLISMSSTDVAAKFDINDKEALAANPAVGPLLTLPAMIGIYEARAAEADKARLEAEKKVKLAEAATVAANASKVDAGKMFDDKIVALQKENTDRFVKITNDFNKLVETHKNDAATPIQRVAAIGAENLKLDEQLKQMEVAIKSLKEKLQKYDDEVRKSTTASVDFVNMEERKGEIVKKEEGGYVTINIGSSKKLRPQVTFLVVSAGVSWLALLEKEEQLKKDSYRQERQAFEDNPYVKAGIEVVEILGADRARAKIIFENDPIRNPVQIRDQIFNLAWAPAEEIRVAFAGIIDLDGDGLDNNEDFLRLLERQGVVVDEYLRLKPLEFVKRDGKGMSLMTRYLIISTPPSLDAVGSENAQSKERIIAISNQMGDIRKRAAELGVQLIDARKFLAMIGYKLPKNPSPPQYGASAYFDKSAPAPAPMAEPKKE